MLSGVYLLLSILAWLRYEVGEALDCVDDVVSVVVSKSADTVVLAEALACPGSLNITVDWYGSVTLTSTLSVGNESCLSVTGLDDAVMDGDGALQLLVVRDGAALNLRHISLENGWAAEKGGAISVYESSVSFYNCSFSGNTAVHGGGECHSHSCHAHNLILVENRFSHQLTASWIGLLCPHRFDQLILALDGGILTCFRSTSFDQRVDMR